MSATSDTLAGDRIAGFALASRYIEAAASQLESLAVLYSNSDLDPVKKQARVDALRAKADYLRGLPLNPNAHPWTES